MQSAQGFITNVMIIIIMKFTTISIELSVRDKLASLGTKNSTYNQIIIELLRKTRKL